MAGIDGWRNRGTVEVCGLLGSEPDRDQLGLAPVAAHEKGSADVRHQSAQGERHDLLPGEFVD